MSIQIRSVKLTEDLTRYGVYSRLCGSQTEVVYLYRLVNELPCFGVVGIIFQFYDAQTRVTRVEEHTMQNAINKSTSCIEVAIIEGREALEVDVCSGMEGVHTQ